MVAALHRDRSALGLTGSAHPLPVAWSWVCLMADGWLQFGVVRVVGGAPDLILAQLWRVPD